MRERSYYIHIVLFEAKIGKRKLWMLKQEANKVDTIVALDLNIVFICDLRMNSFEKSGNDPIHVRCCYLFLGSHKKKYKKIFGRNP
jgi:hypothetical protein